MKTITFVSIASLLVASATLAVVQKPEKIPQAVWNEVPTLPGTELTVEEVNELNRTFGHIPAAPSEVARSNRVAPATQAGGPAVSHAKEASPL